MPQQVGRALNGNLGVSYGIVGAVFDRPLGFGNDILADDQAGERSSPLQASMI
jgi:hypothetical protein